MAEISPRPDAMKPVGLASAVADVSYMNRPVTLRQVATNTALANNFNATNKQMMFRTAHVMRAHGGVTALQVGFANFYVPISGIEAGVGATTTFTGSIEYPSGTFTQLKFSGSSSYICPDNSIALSDLTNVTIPEGAVFWVRMYSTSAAGIIFTSCTNANLNVQMGESLTYGVSGVVDQTMGGTVPLADAGVTVHRPCCILGYSSTAVPYIVGDSRGANPLDTAAFGILETGHAVLFNDLPYLNVSTGGARTTSWTTSAAGRAQRVALSAYATHGVQFLGINDLNIPTPAATIQANRQAIAGYMPALQWWQVTIDPYTSASTDSYATIANQTVGPNEAIRVAINTWVRAGATPFAGYFDIADAIESSRNSGKWKVSSTQGPFTVDGLHANQAGRYEVMRIQPVNTGVFRV